MRKIKVIFKKDRNLVWAFFPDAADERGNISSYNHFDRFGYTNKEFVRNCKPANDEEYVELLKELQVIMKDCKFLIRKRI